MVVDHGRARDDDRSLALGRCLGCRGRQPFTDPLRQVGRLLAEDLLAGKRSAEALGHFDRVPRVAFVVGQPAWCPEDARQGTAGAGGAGTAKLQIDYVLAATFEYDAVALAEEMHRKVG